MIGTATTATGEHSMVLRRTIRAMAATALLLLLGASQRSALVDYPEGFRRWTHIKSGVNGPAYGPYEGMYNIYGNAKALRGYRSGRFPDGAMLIFDLHRVRTESNGPQPAERKFIDVMQKDARRFRSTSGWGYEEFAGGDRNNRVIAPDARMKRCHSCHVAQQSADSVITRFSD
ncbi:MAG: cytochrome P460 family protein [Sphingomonas sp.]|uniref:cytochrome P460 family protein n=1 Tax=Sphingomonas sp. TaxID=28214 RepID=UPI001818A7DE|nr:cytochrome P460 family protein [Sphingomonas sp.]MBA3667238.1 cytochrome P460 family protein [Sphingomonas sp.]